MAGKQPRTPQGTARGSAGVDAYLAALEHPRKAAIQALRKVVLSADPRIREELKWNAPSFYIEEHFATFRLRPGDILQLVLHAGAKKGGGAVHVDDPHGLLERRAADRCVATFGDTADVRAKAPALEALLAQWIAAL